jgi:hypothetical protein
MRMVMRLYCVKAGSSLSEDECIMIPIYAQSGHSEKTQGHEEWQRSCDPFELLFIPAVLPQEMSYIRFCSSCVILMNCKIVFELCCNCSKIVDKVGMLPGAL